MKSGEGFYDYVNTDIPGLNQERAKKYIGLLKEPGYS